jgi:sterol desaturase/sphingolipid hydroxylase (fatty acid hydroxylase superfamily)
MHKVHHSREKFETDSNYSNIFSIWDRIFGTYTATVDFSRLRYGLDGFDDHEKQTVPALLKLPFVNET